ncbi:MAG: NUDIX hydrolase [Gammaproteobacteria bacterium]|nr:NUDIX hydrolase [Gammaproteobacteria bacterium]MBL7000008.1 NUDIX hydrolase [Gammaproteobacteria bacterium]
MTESSVWKPHVTVAAICEKNHRFLLVRELVKGREVFNQPAGHLDPGESLEQAVIRETREETAYDFTPQQLCGIYRYIPQRGIEETIIRFAYSGVVGQQHQHPLDEGILSAEWMTLDEIRQTRADHRSTLVLQCVLDYLEKPSYPLQVFRSACQ